MKWVAAQTVFHCTDAEVLLLIAGKILTVFTFLS